MIKHRSRAFPFMEKSQLSTCNSSISRTILPIRTTTNWQFLKRICKMNNRKLIRAIQAAMFLKSKDIGTNTKTN